VKILKISRDLKNNLNIKNNIVVKKKRIYIAGQGGMVGQSIYRLLKSKKYHIIDCKRKDLNLVNQKDVQNWFKKNKPEIVINAAGKVGGILDNSTNQMTYIYNNVMIGFNLVNSSFNYNVKTFINLGSACIYPRKTDQPIKEEYLLSSYLENTNEGYALAKISVLKYVEYIRKFYKKDFISLMPANLYGVGDNFDLDSSHVIPALIRKFHLAKIYKKKRVEVWGSGVSKREFLHTEDLASAVLFCLNKNITENNLNIGSSDYLTIKELAKLIKKITAFEGDIYYNKKYPEGVKFRKLDFSKIYKLGWRPKIRLEDGLNKYYKYFQSLNLN
jgi:GDP-L-fucose synthase